VALALINNNLRGQIRIEISYLALFPLRIPHPNPITTRNPAPARNCYYRLPPLFSAQIPWRPKKAKSCIPPNLLGTLTQRGLRFTGLRSEFSRSLLSRNHVRNAFGRGRRRIKNSSTYAAATKKNVCRGHDCSSIVGSQRLLHKNLFRKVQLFVSQSTVIHFARYRFSFRKVQIFNSESTDFHLAKYRFRKHFVS